MSQEKRLVVFCVVAVAYLFGALAIQRYFAPPPAAQVAEAKVAPEVAAPDLPAGKVGFIEGVDDVFANPAAAHAPAPGVVGELKAKPIAPRPGKVEPVEPAELVLGSADDRSGRGYHLKIQLDQQGAGVAAIWSALYEAEWEGRQNPNQPLPLIRRDPNTPPSFRLDLVPPDSLEPDESDNIQLRAEKEAAKARYSVGDVAWEVLRDAAGRVVRVAPPREKGGLEGQEVRFRAVGGDGIAVTKTYRLYPGRDALELNLEFAAPGAPRAVAYKLFGPHGIPIEGEWYTSTFREDVIGLKKLSGGVEITSLPASDVVSKKNKDEIERLTERPLEFAGVENQYFTVFLRPERPEQVAATEPIVVKDDPEAHQKADVSVLLTSKPAEVGPGHVAAHAYAIYAGPKTVAALKPFAAEGLAVYRKGWGMLGIGHLASWLATNVIARLLDRIYALTAQLGGARGGSYGIAIILLTVCVRLMLFPLGRRTAINAKKMQALQPQINELKEKYKGQTEVIFKEQQALFRKHKVSMLGGCLTAIIQLPIFMGLWQALNNSVALRHAPFLWIKNLAAPDMLFRFPVPLPLIGTYLGDYFNVLPFVVVGLMLVQNKLFMPPASTPEAEMQQKMMKYMMIVMAFMFYKVPSGLGLYFITSSLWSIGERLLLPKVIHVEAPADDEFSEGGGKGPSAGGGKGPSGGNGNGNGGGWLSRKLEALMEEAAKERTIRNAEPERPPGRGNDRDRDRGKGPDRSNRPKPGKRR